MINKLFAFFFIAYLLSSCVEDIENYALGNVDNMIPDGKELMELRLVIPGDNSRLPEALRMERPVRTGLSSFTWMLWTAAGIR